MHSNFHTSLKLGIAMSDFFDLPHAILIKSNVGEADATIVACKSLDDIGGYIFFCWERDLTLTFIQKANPTKKNPTILHPQTRNHRSFGSHWNAKYPLSDWAINWSYCEFCNILSKHQKIPCCPITAKLVLTILWTVGYWNDTSKTVLINKLQKPD